MAAPAPRFSILLPTHNRADVLSYAIRSALWQTEKDFELLIAGDGCTDNTAEVIGSFPDPRIRWFDLPKAPGIGYANRNIVLRQARGTLVAYLAHDDIWFPDHLEKLGSVLTARDAEFVYARSLAVDLRGRMTPYWFNLEVPRHRAGLARGRSALTMCSVVHTCECLAKYGYWSESLLRGGDTELWYRILTLGGSSRLAFFPEVTSLHFVADWRETDAQRRTDVTGWLLNGFLEDKLPPALRLSNDSARSQQEAAWLRLSRDPSTSVADIRRAVVQLQDALLWQGRPASGLLALRTGFAVGASLEWLWDRLRRITSPTLRRQLALRETMTRSLDKRARDPALR